MRKHKECERAVQRHPAGFRSASGRPRFVVAAGSEVPALNVDTRRAERDLAVAVCLYVAAAAILVVARWRLGRLYGN